MQSHFPRGSPVVSNNKADEVNSARSPSLSIRLQDVGWIGDSEIIVGGEIQHRFPIIGKKRFCRVLHGMQMRDEVPLHWR